ncbi:MAG: hypothetical protein K2N56_07665 [Oscillospiraceae bacterium]|nr:hypothetical protein [Oscillospiraceae bacterium]
MSGVNFFGIRHLSPAGAHFLRGYLDEIRPKLVLIEAPSDFEDVSADIVREETKPPFAILAYTDHAPVRTILYPFAEYSPEYQAILWCHENKVKFGFMDLPSETFLALYEQRIAEEERLSEEEAERDDLPEDETADEKTEGTDSGEPDKERGVSVYEKLDKLSGENSHETFWERTLEHCADIAAYNEGANLFGENIRALSEERDDAEEIALREKYMRGRIREAVSSGIAPDEIVVVTGAYHVEGLKLWENSEATEELPKTNALHTLMPYSYYRLSTRSGYGAGNNAPGYYELIWEAYKRDDPFYTANAYLTKIAAAQRKGGNAASSAQVIEAVRLAASLAEMRGGLASSVPVLRDLRDAAETCIGEGSFGAIGIAAAEVEIGTKIGALPEGVSRTSIQDDFYRLLKDLKLEKYRSVTAQELKLDLRENRRASSEKSAFLDLNRSFFLHKLRVLNIDFAKRLTSTQDSATWAEGWTIQWTPESEIVLVESALKGDTVELAASFELKERVESAPDMSTVAEAIEDAFYCGMSGAASYAVAALQAMAVDAVSFEELAKTALRLSNAVTYGDIRHADSSPLIPMIRQLYYRACLILTGACVCDDAAASVIAEAMNSLNSVELAQDFLNTEDWISALRDTAGRDDLNTKLSGFAAAILLERSQMTNDELKIEVSRRLSKGVPADLGAGWFEGLTMKNRYGLIARLSLWESLDEYIQSLDDEEFKRALVFLRRAFADFSSAEKDSIAENLGEIWGLNGAEVSEIVNAELDTASKEQIEALDDFDFDI